MKEPRLLPLLLPLRMSCGGVLLAFLLVNCPVALGQDLSGIWSGRIIIQGGTSDVELILNQAGANLSGTVVWKNEPRLRNIQSGPFQLVINAGVIDSGRVVFTAQDQSQFLAFRFDGVAAANSIKGAVEVSVMGRESMKGTIEVYKGATASGVSTESGESPSASPSPVLCSDYASCMDYDYKARNLQEALARFEKASTLEPSRSEPWYGMGLLYFELSDYQKAWDMWDRALSVGVTAGGQMAVGWVVCRERRFQPCEKGALGLSSRAVTLTKGREPSIEVVFSAPPSEVTSRPANLYYTGSAAYSWLTVGGKKYRLYYVPMPTVVECQIGDSVICPEPGFTQQKVFANYVHHAIQALASGALAKVEPPPTVPPSGFPAGDWRGTVVQPGFGSYPATIRLDASGGGTVNLETLGCAGSLTFSGKQGEKYVYDYRLEHGTNCTPSVTNVFELREEGNLHLEVFFPDGRLAASGTLHLDSTHPPAPARHAVVPGGTIGQFRHGTLVTKLPSGSLVVAPTPQDATHMHPGVDMVAGSGAAGTPIYAFADGTVTDVIDTPADPDFGVPGKTGLGYMVIVKHTEQIAGMDTYTAYFHMDKPPSVRRNQTVIGGQTQLGVVGMTGAATAPHLHLEVRHFGSRYLERPEWNQPWNIYGVGDQRSSALFLQNWENPETLGIPLI